MSIHRNFDSAVLQSVLKAILPLPQEISPKDKMHDPVVWTLPGFASGVRVGTTFGDLPIEALRVRDEVRAACGKIVRVQWIDKIHLDEEFLSKHPSAQPVRIPANAFGQGKPMQDMVVSPQQEVSPEPHVASHFRSAKDLCSQGRANRVRATGLTYYRFHCGDPVAVRVEGLWVKVGR